MNQNRNFLVQAGDTVLHFFFLVQKLREFMVLLLLHCKLSFADVFESWDVLLEAFTGAKYAELSCFS